MAFDDLDKAVDDRVDKIAPLHGKRARSTAHYPTGFRNLKTRPNNGTNQEKFELLIKEVCELETECLKSCFKSFNGNHADIFSILDSTLEAIPATVSARCDEHTVFVPEFGSKERKDIIALHVLANDLESQWNYLRGLDDKVENWGEKLCILSPSGPAGRIEQEGKDVHVGALPPRSSHGSRHSFSFAIQDDVSSIGGRYDLILNAMESSCNSILEEMDRVGKITAEGGTVQAKAFHIHKQVSFLHFSTLRMDNVNHLQLSDGQTRPFDLRQFLAANIDMP